MRLTRSDNICTAWVGWRLACDREDTQSVSIARGIQRRQTNELTSIAGYSARERSSVAAMAGNVLVRVGREAQIGQKSKGPSQAKRGGDGAALGLVKSTHANKCNRGTWPPSGDRERKKE